MEASKKNTILIIAGTRPEEIKTYKLVSTLKKSLIPVLYAFTGQHQNLFDKTKYDLIYTIPNENNLNRLDSIVLNNVSNFGKLFSEYPQIKYVMVQGDTTSALSVALSAFHHGIKVIHLESGLRTYDNENPYPEEVNRRIIANIASIHLCPTKQNYDNLINENILGDKYIVGNTALDNLLEYKNKTSDENIVLITLHRRENHDIIDKWFSEINKIAKKYDRIKFILPLHPNPNIQKHKGLLINVEIINPLQHNDLLELLIKCKLVITDSGGLQEECSFLQKKCIVCRKVTERPEALGISSHLVPFPADLEKCFIEMVNKDETIKNNNNDCPFGNGYSCEIISEILKKYIN